MDTPDSIDVFRNFSKSKPSRLNATELIKLLMDYGYGDRLSYDYKLKRILLDGADFDLNQIHGHILMRFNCYIGVPGLLEAFAAIAKNMSKPPKKEINLLSVLEDFLKGRDNITIKDLVLLEHIQVFLTDMSRKGIEIKLALALKKLGYTRKRSNGKTTWILQNKEEK